MVIRSLFHTEYTSYIAFSILNSRFACTIACACSYCACKCDVHVCVFEHTHVCEGYIDVCDERVCDLACARVDKGMTDEYHSVLFLGS